MAIRNNEEPEDLEEQLEELDRKVDRLRVLFEQFFLGIEKRPPLELQKDVVRLMRHIGNYHIRKTSLKFRFQSISQRFNVHRAYWNRTLREIEDGTYRRDRSRAERREEARTGERIDAAELAKRTTLRKVLGDEAVEERRQRLSDDDSSNPDRGAYVPAVARRRTQRMRRSAADIRGISADEIAEQVAQRKAAVAAARAPEAQEAPDTPLPLAPTRPRPSLRRDHPAEAGMGSPLTPVPGPADNNATPAPRARPAPTLSRRPSAPASPTHHPSSPAATPVASATAATEVLRNAGLPPERAQRIYNDWLRAREHAGQPTQGVSYERLVESMARQVPKLRESHGVRRVDFEVVTKGDKVYLKPRTK